MECAASVPFSGFPLLICIEPPLIALNSEIKTLLDYYWHASKEISLRNCILQMDL
jgi:hypothetical protein